VRDDVGYTVLRSGTLKTRDHEIYGGGKRRTGKRGTKFAGVEKAGQACMEREMTKNRNFSLIDNPVWYNAKYAVGLLQDTLRFTQSNAANTSIICLTFAYMLNIQSLNKYSTMSPIEI